MEVPSSPNIWTTFRAAGPEGLYGLLLALFHLLLPLKFPSVGPLFLVPFDL